MSMSGAVRSVLRGHSQGAYMESVSLHRGVPLQPTLIDVKPVVPAAESRDVIQAVKALNQTEMFGQDNQLVFQRDRQTQRMVIRVVNSKTNEVVSQIPPEYVLRLAKDYEKE